MNPLVSVIVTSYNHAEYLGQRIDSLLAQTYRPLEIVVVDDHSLDDSAKVLDAYRNFPQINVKILEKNLGYAHAVNAGVRLSAGDYIMFAECDDYSHPEQIKVLLSALLNNESTGVGYSRSNIVDEKGAVLGDDFKGREEAFKIRCSRDTLITRKEMQRFLLTSCVIPNMSAVLMRKKYFDRVEGLSPLYKACADWDFWCRVAEHCDFYYVCSPLNNFRTHQTTVRETSGIKTPVCEIFDVLYRASSRVRLSPGEKRRFKTNVGFIWASYILLNALEWLRSFPGIWRCSLRYEKLSIVYLIGGFMQSGMLLLKKTVTMITMRV